MASEPERELDKEQRRYQLALGGFVMAWADTEEELYRVLKHYAGINDGVARAVFSGARASAMCNYLYAILHNTQVEDTRRKDLEFVLAQIAAINTMRDRVIHFSSANLVKWQTDDPTTRFLDNASRVSRYGKHFVERVGSVLVEQMTNDLFSVQNHLNQHWHQKKNPFEPWEENPGEPTTWLYKPAQPRKKASPKPQRQR